MTKQTTELTRQDLKIYASQRLTDTADGGGPMTARELTGAANELFGPISDVARTMGGFDARLVYPAVLRDDTAELLGAHVVVSEPPQSNHVSTLLFAADHYGQTRASAMERIEAYAVPTVENRMTLLGTQRKGSRMVQVYQRDNAPLPVVGQTFALRLEINRQFVYEFIRVEKFTHELRTFEDEKGEFVRRVINMTIQQALERDFEGAEDASRYKATPPARVLDTQVADSGRYYGIKPLAAPLAKGSAAVQLTGIYEQLVPVSAVETALADDWAQGKEMWIETGSRIGLNWLNDLGPGSRCHLPVSVLPGSVQMGNFMDDGMGTLSDGVRQIYIDYSTGVLSSANNIGVGEISVVPAVKVRNYAYSSYIHIDDTNIGTEWAPLLTPAPARGSVSVSFRAGREWYELADPGDYTLRDSQGAVRGSIAPSGSCVISLSVLPDAGSKIIVSWVPHEFYRTFDGSAAGASVPPKTVATELVLPQSPTPNLKPGTLRLAWSGGTAQDDGQGNLTGSVSGKVDYVAGTFKPVGLTAAQLTLSAEQYSQTPAQKEVAVADGGDVMTLVAGAMQRGSLNISLAVTRQDAFGYTVQPSTRFINTTSK